MEKVNLNRPTMERRTMETKIELRAAEGGTDEVIEGYALKFNSWSQVMGNWIPFREKLAPGCLDDCDMSDVRCLFNHDPNQPLGRNTISDGPGNLSMSTDNIGLHFKCQPTDTSYSRDCKTNLRAGVVNQCSFAFTVDDTDDEAEMIEYNEDDEIYEVTVNKIARLYDVSPVTYPAYTNTEAVVGQRSLDKLKDFAEKRQKKPGKPLEIRRKRLELAEKE